MLNTGIAGNRGKDVRSDCFIEFSPASRGGLKIELKSKVNALFGKSIRKLAENILDHFDIKHAHLLIEDASALEFVMAARIEAAIKKVVETEKEFLFPMLDQNKLAKAKDAFRFSRLYLPGNSPKLMINAGIHNPNGIILDLEDSVAVDKKFEAVFLVRNALRNLDFYGAERMVRINQIPKGLDDLKFLIPHHVDLILVPKCESAEDLHKVNKKIDQLKKAHKIEKEIWLMPIIESAKGVINAYEIASAADNVASLAIGLEDYTADLGTRRTNEGTESFFARSMVVNAARAAGIQPIDSVFSDVSDMEALAENVKASKALGFDGMGCIHPRQIKVIQDNFAPGEIVTDPGKSAGPLEFKRLSNPVVPIGLQVVSSFGCATDTVFKTYTRKPVFDVSLDNAEGCPPVETTFQTLTGDNVDEVDYSWDFGDGEIATGTNVSHVFSEPNTRFDIWTVAYSKLTGCYDTLLSSAAVSVYPVPYAVFSAMPPSVLISNPVIHFENKSENATSFLWDFDDQSAFSDKENPDHHFQNMGLYDVRLAAVNEFGCADTTLQQVSVTFDKIFPPTAFSPNAPTEEDREFRIYSEGIVDEGFQLLVFNRWGEKIFESQSQEDGWDGRMKNGDFAPAGVYSWVIRYRDFMGKQFKQQGTVTLLF